MLGIRFIKAEPTDYLLQFKRGKIVRQGAGLAFYYFAPTSSLVRIPVGSVDVPFIFEEVTVDFQKVTIQGQMTFRVADPAKLAHLMNYTLSSNGKSYSSEDPKKLPQRLISEAQVKTSASLKAVPLRNALTSSAQLATIVSKDLRGAETVTSLGVEILNFSVFAIKPTPETARALEAEARESILRQADEAVFSRRNSAVEQERAIKENELNTDIAVENKKRQIMEAKMDADMSAQHKKHELREAEMATKITLEQKNKELLSISTANSREEADAKAYAMAALVKAISTADPKVLQSLLASRMDASQSIALAFKELAENAGKIGELNISPDLLSGLLDKKAA